MRCTNAWTNWASNLSRLGTKQSRHTFSWLSNNRRGEKNSAQSLWSTKGAGKNSARRRFVIALDALDPQPHTKSDDEKGFYIHPLEHPVQALLGRRRHSAEKAKTLAKIRPGSPAPAMGPGTGAAADQIPGLLLAKPKLGTERA